MENTLNQILPGQQAQITAVDTDAHLKARLQAFGLVPGTNVTCRYRSPGKFVTALEFRGTVVALRTRDLKKIRVQA